MPSFTRTQLIAMAVSLSLFLTVHVQAFGTCRSSFRCLNGGEERYGQSIFGPCRCRCRPGFTGPRCQYREVTRKRSSSLSMLSDFLKVRMRAERRPRHDQQMLQQEEAFISADHDTPLERRRRRRDGSGLRLHPIFFRR